MQFKVPQDVQQADRIVSFLTLQQLIICVVGGGFAYAVYTILHNQGLPTIFWIPPVGVMLLLTAAFAFLKIANLPFYKYLMVLLERLIMPSRRVWIKGADRVISDEAYVSPEEQKAKEKEEAAKAMIEEKEAKLKGIGSVMEAIETKKVTAPTATEPAAELKEIEETPDEKLLQKAFLEKPTKITPPSGPSAALPQAPLAGKKKRKRKRKRKNPGLMGAQAQPLPTTPTAPTAPDQMSNGPVAPDKELTEATPTAIEEVPPEPIVVQEKEELMIPEEPVLPPESVSPPSPPSAQSQSLQTKGEFTADQLRAGATLKVPTDKH